MKNIFFITSLLLLGNQIAYSMNEENNTESQRLTIALDKLRLTKTERLNSDKMLFDSDKMLFARHTIDPNLLTHSSLTEELKPSFILKAAVLKSASLKESEIQDIRYLESGNSKDYYATLNNGNHIIANFFVAGPCQGSFNCILSKKSNGDWITVQLNADVYHQLHNLYTAQNH